MNISVKRVDAAAKPIKCVTKEFDDGVRFGFFQVGPLPEVTSGYRIWTYGYDVY